MTTFSNLARGKGLWDGQLELAVDLSPTNDKMVSAEFTSLPVLVPDDVLKHTGRRRSSVTSASSGRSYRGDRELLLPKTYTTRKGALMLFTPPGEFSLTEGDKVYLDKAFSADNYVDYANTFGSLARLAQSVLMYGNQENEEGMSICDTHNKMNMRFLHSPHDNMIDTKSQPGGDVSHYLRELRSRCSATSSYRAMSDDGKETQTEEDSWPGDTMMTPVTVSDTLNVVTVDGDTLMGQNSSPVSRVSITVSPRKPKSSSPRSPRRRLPGDKLMSSGKGHPYRHGKATLDFGTRCEPQSRAPTPVMQLSFAETLSYQSGRSSLSTSDEGSCDVGSLDDLELYPACNGVEAMAGSRTDYSDEYSLETLHSLERSTQGRVLINVGGAAQPLVPVYGGSFQSNGGTWSAANTSLYQPVSTPVSSSSDDGSVTNDAHVVKVEVTSHTNSDVSSELAVSPTPTPQGGRTIDDRWPSGSGSVQEKQFHSPTTTTPDVMTVRPPYPPSVPVTASKRGSVAGQRSFLSGRNSAKTRSDRTTCPDSTVVLKEAPQASRSMLTSEVQREVVSMRDDLTLQAAIETVSLVKTNLNEQITGAGVETDKRFNSELNVNSAGVVPEERPGVPLVSEVGFNADKLVSHVGGHDDKLVSEVDELDANVGSLTGIEKGLELMSITSEVELKVCSPETTKTTATEGDKAKKVPEVDSLFDAAEEVMKLTPRGKKAEKKETFAKIVKKKQIKKTRKNEETRQKRTNLVAEKEALRESRRVEKQQALDLQNQREEAMAKLADEKNKEIEKREEAERIAESKRAEREAKDTAHKVAQEEREARRKAEAERKKEAASRRRSEHKLMQETARQKESDMLMKIAGQEERKKVATEEGRKRRSEEDEIASLKEEEECKYKAMLATRRESEKLAEMRMKVEIDEMNCLIRQKEEADKRDEMMRRKAERLQHGDLDIQVTLAEDRLQRREDVELRQLIEEQRVVRAEIERRQKLKQEQVEQEEEERRDMVRTRELTLQRQSYNLEQSTYLRNVCVSQTMSRPFSFSYYVTWPRNTYQKFGSADVQGKVKKKRGKKGKSGKTGRKHKGKK